MLVVGIDYLIRDKSDLCMSRDQIYYTLSPIQLGFEVGEKTTLKRGGLDCFNGM